MEVKKNLNGMQRKMLDEIYSDQFKKKQQVIIQRREAGLTELRGKVLESESVSKQLKPMLTAGARFFELLEANADYMRDNGIGFHRSRIEEKPRLELHSYYNNILHPKVKEYQIETDRIKDDLEGKRREMRAKIYGLNVTYEEADAEVSALLESIKV